jgi:hypothetical protein
MDLGQPANKRRGERLGPVAGAQMLIRKLKRLKNVPALARKKGH